ncbi:MAG TPA: tyrosine--tRNA ligase [Verrucomicrobiae bacterium]|nr:tyrosine--tRNA ligase [Verrucomicrobiae bacterium]
MTLSEELRWRGFVNQTTLNDPSELDKKPITFYFGVDPSADSMQVGNLAIAMMIRHFLRHGHKAVLLVGGATGMIGDPGGKDEERTLKSIDEVVKNKTAIARQYQHIFDGMPFTLVDNYDWFKDIGYLDFLREVGKSFSMTQLLDRDFVRSRIGEGGSGISYAEFSYTLIQGYDFLHLYREHGVTLQVCGSDQWGNSITGVELIRKLEGAEAHVWSAPLVINRATGKKFGKSEDGAVWLDDKKTSVYKFYQFWLNTDDEGVIDYLKIYTLLSKDEITALIEEHQQNPAARLAQQKLAEEVTKLVHGEARTQAVRNITDALFGGKAFADMAHDELQQLAAEIPTAANTEIVEGLVEAGIAQSKGEARRLLQSGAISVNGEKITEPTTFTQPTLVKKGKNTFCLLAYAA